MNMNFERKLPIPMEVKEMYPLSAKGAALVDRRRIEMEKIFSGNDDRIVLIIGPCSADNEDSVMDYISRLAELQQQVKDKIMIVPRIYTNKPRTTGQGYKGLVHQPDPTGNPDAFNGIIATRQLHMRAIDETEFTCADEMLYPQNYKYLDDYLLAIDEMTGVGWWATDRLQIPGKVVIYIFVPNSVRRNCDADSEDVYSLAAVKSIKDTWEADTDYSAYRERINAITYEDDTEENEFVFHVRNGLTYTRFDDFRSAEARGLMEKHVKVASFIDDIRSQLANLRRSYRTASKANKQQYAGKIETLERSILKNEDELRGIARAIRAAELSQIKGEERDD